MAKKNHSPDVMAAFKVLDDLNPEATFLNESALSNISSFIDTGSMALNAIISGSLSGGIPSGRITGFSGPTSCGKTYIINRILANAQKIGRYVVIFDTENAVDNKGATNMGIDTSKVKYCPVETVEQCRNQISQFLDSVIEKKLKGQFIISIDSLGNLVSTKEMNDVAQGKEAMDMGSRAKGLKSMLRVLTHKAAKADVPILFSNHVYDNPGAMFPSLVKQQSGGSGPLYMSTVLVQMAVKNEKTTGGNTGSRDAVEDSSPMSKDINGVTLRALTTKNRVVPPFMETEMYLNFKSGLSKYSGLLDMAVGYGVVIQNGATFALQDGTKLGYYKNWRDNDEVWSKILPELEVKLQQELQYKKENQQPQQEPIEDDQEDDQT
jgi:RecA/RadA recombinase